jgi:kynureninase
MLSEFKNKALQLDEKDPLKDYRNKFEISDTRKIYLDGNSLGRLPIESKRKMYEVISEEWGSNLINSWNDHWLKRMKTISLKLASVLGAKENEVLLADSTSLNLFKLVFALLNSNHGKSKIITDDLNFPTDIYILESVINLLGGVHELVVVKSKDSVYPDLDELCNQIDENTALVTLSHVVFKSGYKYDIKDITEFARSKGVPVVWDLSHSAGAVPLYFGEWKIEYAVGCTYKYLNGGPGAPAYLYVNEKLQKDLTSPIWGWFGDSSPFEFRINFNESPSIEKFYIGTPPMLSVSAIEPALDITIEAGMENIREKSELQSQFLYELIEEELLPLGFTIGSPEDVSKRGSHISIRHPEGYRITQALINSDKLEKNIVPDFRTPDNIRLGIAPLYNSYIELLDAVEMIKRVLDDSLYVDYSSEINSVT